MNLKIVGILFSVLCILPVVFSIGFHYPSEILNGNFSGNYNFENGRIGINMTNPTVALDVDGDIKVGSDDDICIEGGNCLSTVSGGGGGSGEWTLSNSNLSYSSGNVGIGTTTPTGQLQIDSYGNQDVLLINGYNGNPLVQVRDTAYDDLWVSFKNSTNDRVVFFHTQDIIPSYILGAVGINTQGDQYTALNIKSRGLMTSAILVNSSDGDPLFRVQESGGNTGWLALYDDAGNQDVFIHSAANSFFNGGNFGLGTSSPISKLHIEDDFTVATAGLTMTDSDSGNTLVTLTRGGSSGTDDGRLIIYTDNSPSIQFTGNSGFNHFINNGGYLGVGTASPSVMLDVIGSIEYTGEITDVSDRRLKENFELINNPINKINSLTGYTFNMVGDNLSDRSAGLIAQEVNEVLPEAVSIIDDEGHLGLDYTQIVPLLVEGMKEQQNQILELQNKNLELIERIELIEK